jgi:asparagine synthase (glutamine-hydrolysing)
MATPDLLLAAAAELRHRGPDGVGLYLDGRFGMANTRLAVVDLESGDQPLSDERGRFWVMQNGEIYNHVELRTELERIGHAFATTSDTEVIAHAYAEWGAECLHRFNGDFAIAVWDRREQELFLARDRFGVRPLFLAELAGDLCFASEVKALLRHPDAPRRLDPVGIVDTFTTWATLPDRSAFAGIRELAPAHLLLVRPDGSRIERRWWDAQFDPAETSEAAYVEELEALLDDAVRIRLRADVEVATYLSGGLDSSTIAALASDRVGDGLAAFGVGFADRHYDESGPQDAIARVLGVDFRRTVVDGAAIAAALPEVVELAEKPILRTAPAPLLLLSKAVRDAGLKVVLTGEGADELFAGYDIFREDKVRRFWAREPSSVLRPLLLTRLNRWLPTDPARAGAFLTRFYARGLEDVDDPLYSHRLRFANTSRALKLLAPDVVAAAAGAEPALRLERMLPPDFGGMTPLARAQYLEIATFLEGYLLHAQGDRMLMGNSVEGRFPFLDHRVAELALRLPDRLRLRGLEEKHLLRRTALRRLPAEIGNRPKIPYRAPIRSVFGGECGGDELLAALEPARIRAAEVLEPVAVERLVRKFRSGAAVGETDEMALVGALSLSLLHERFVAQPRRPSPLEASRVVVGAAAAPSPVGAGTP